VTWLGQDWLAGAAGGQVARGRWLAGGGW